jgi:DUF971 family protein
MHTPTPREVRRDGTTGLTINWSDGAVQQLSSELLRRNCPCAGCREQRGDTSHAKPLTAKRGGLRVLESSLSEETALNSVEGVGNYALRLRWGDGHTDGIFTFEYLRGLVS